MNKIDYEKYFENQKLRLETPPGFFVKHIEQRDRTLLYGYTANKLTHHVYLKDNELTLYIYGAIDENVFLKNWKRDDFVSIPDIIPDKRLYPSACDFEFCRMIKDRNIILPFTNYKKRPAEKFYGDIAP